MDSNTDEKILELASSLEKIYDEGHIYNANVIVELHASENAHSRILRMLLQFKKDNTYPLFNSFVNKFIPEITEVSAPVFFNEKDRIDLLVKDEKYAVIIENKAKDAVDQPRQIERYLHRVIGGMAGGSRIFVIYLTRDGAKIVSSDSLTDEAKRLLENRGSFIEINYKTDILGWLREIKDSTAAEPLLYSAIIQYIDYLENVFISSSSEEMDLNNRINEKMKTELGITNVGDCFDAEAKLLNLQNRLAEEKFKFQKDIIANLEKQLNEKWKVNDSSFNRLCEIEFDGKSLSICLGTFEMGAYQLKTETENGRLFYGIAAYAPGTSPELEAKIETCRDRLGLRPSIAWPCWAWTDYYPQSKAFWTTDPETIAENITNKAREILEVMASK